MKKVCLQIQTNENKKGKVHKPFQTTTKLTMSPQTFNDDNIPINYQNIVNDPLMTKLPSIKKTKTKTKTNANRKKQ